MIIKFSREFLEKVPSAGDFVQNSYFRKTVRYVIDSKYRTAVSLQPWIQSLTMPGSVELGVPGAADTAAVNALKGVIRDIVYVGDAQKWKMSEKWQEPEITAALKSGDCEDGAIYLYTLLRSLGVPANKLMLFCGDVTDPKKPKSTVGHCWLGYRPEEYPLNWVFLDWCYWPSGLHVEQRAFFFIKGDQIIELDPSTRGSVPSTYKKMWFCFNEETSFLKLDWRPPSS